MSKSSTKTKAPKGKNAFKQGYVSFTPEDLQQRAQQDLDNAEAYKYLDKAMFTSSHITETDKNNNEVDIDDVYPITLDEVNEMDTLLDKAEQVAKNPSEPFFVDRLGELRGIVAWSRKRHWNFSWKIILGVIVSVFFMMKWAASAEKKANISQATIDRIEAWTEMDTVIAFDSFKDKKPGSRNGTDINANSYKSFTLNKIAYNYYSFIKTSEECVAKADTATSTENKTKYMTAAKNNRDDAEKYKKEYDEINAYKFSDIQKYALEKAENFADEDSSYAAWMNFLFYFFLLCIPLYIFADRPYGYVESRNRTEAKVLGGIRKIGFAIAGFLAGGAFAMGYLPDTLVKTTYSDGSSSTNTEFNVGNIMVMAIKAAMYLLALIIVCAVSCFILVYSTITGLIRNYDWKTIYFNLKTRFAKKNIQ